MNLFNFSSLFIDLINSDNVRCPLLDIFIKNDRLPAIAVNSAMLRRRPTGLPPFDLSDIQEEDLTRSCEFNSIENRLNLENPIEVFNTCNGGQVKVWFQFDFSLIFPLRHLGL